MKFLLLVFLCCLAATPVFGISATHPENGIVYSWPWQLGGGTTPLEPHSTPWANDELPDPDNFPNLNSAYVLTQGQDLSMDLGANSVVLGFTFKTTAPVFELNYRKDGEGYIWNDHYGYGNNIDLATQADNYSVESVDGYQVATGAYMFQNGREVIRHIFIKPRGSGWFRMVIDPIVIRDPIDCEGSFDSSIPVQDFFDDGDIDVKVCHQRNVYQRTFEAFNGGIDCPHADGFEQNIEANCTGEVMFHWRWKHFGTYIGQNTHTQPSFDGPDGVAWFGSTMDGQLNMDFGEPRAIMGLEVKGFDDGNNVYYIKKWQIRKSHSLYTPNWAALYYDDPNTDAIWHVEETGLTDGTTPSTIMFHETFTTQYLQIDPFECHHWCALKIRVIFDNGPEIVMGSDASGNLLKCTNGDCEVYDEAAGKYVDTSSTADAISSPITVSREFQPYGDDGDLAKMENENLIIKKPDGTIVRYRSDCA